MKQPPKVLLARRKLAHPPFEQLVMPFEHARRTHHAGHGVEQPLGILAIERADREQRPAIGRQHLEHANNAFHDG